MLSRLMPERRLLAIAPFAVSAIFLPACGSEERAPTSEQPDELTYELLPWATELAPEVLETITENDLALGILRFKGSPEAVATRQPGDVLVGGKSTATPKGLLRAVVSVTQDSGDTLVETLPIPLPLAFKSLHASLSRQGVDLVSPEGVTGATSLSPALAPQIYKASKVVEGKRIFDAELYNLDDNIATKDDQFLVHAELQGHVGYAAKVDLDWLDSGGAIDHAKDCLDEIISDPAGSLTGCVKLPDVKVSFEASLSGNGLLDVDGASSKHYESDPIPINEQPWELPDLYAGPVVLTPELDFTAKVEGDAATYFHARTEFGYDVSVKAAVGTTSGVTPPEPTFEKNVTQPIVEVSSTGHSKASFGPRLSLMAYGTFGFSADLHGFGTLDADQAKTPCWDYTLGIELTPGIRLRIPWKKFGLQKLADKLGWNWDFAYGLIDPITLYQDHPFDGVPAEQRACKLPPVSALPLGEGPTNETYQNPTFSPWSYRFGDVEATQPASSDPGESKALIDKTHSSSWLISGSMVGSVIHLADDGSVAWARAIDVGLLPDESAAYFTQATSALALASDKLDIFVASDRLTLLALDYDGNVKWARRLRLPTGVPEPDLLELTPVAMTPLSGGDFGILYSRQTYAHLGSQIVLLRVSNTGSVRFAKRFSFPGGDRTLGSTVVAIGQDQVVTGVSSTSSESAAYFARFDATGALTYAKRLIACGDVRTYIESGTLRASGDLALFGTYGGSPDRTFFATLSPDGESHGVHAIWTGSILEDIAAVTLAELPTSGFVSLTRYTPYVYTSNALELSTHDSQGIRTDGKGYALKDQAGTDLSEIDPAALRLTTDGGALVVAHVTKDADLNDFGLWISKLPARTFDAPFDPTFVVPATNTFPEDTCSLDLTAASVTPEDLVLEDVDVSELVSAKPLTPTIQKRMQ